MEAASAAAMAEMDLLRRVLQEWARVAHDKQLQEMKRRQAVRFHYFLLLRKGYQGLKQLVQDQHARRQLLQRVTSRKNLARTFYLWSHYSRERQREAIQFRLHWMQRAFDGWRTHHQRAVHFARLVRTADGIHHISLLRRSFVQWREFLTTRHHRRVQVEASFELHQAQANLVHVAEAFQRWHRFAQRSTAEQLILHHVRSRSQAALTKRVFDAWVQFVGMRRWDEILYFRAAKHRALVTQKQMLLTWQANAALCRTARAQTVAALTHWKLSMQRRVFHSWLHRVHARQAKRHHLHEALEWRHTHFLQQGLVHWAQAAFVLREQRLQHVQTQAAAAAARLWRRVAQIAAHWRYVAKHGAIQGDRRGKSSGFHRLPTKAKRSVEAIQPLGMASVAVTSSAHHRLPPRKPLDLLYDGEVVPSTAGVTSMKPTRPMETNAAMHVAIEKYGLSMPTPQVPRRSRAADAADASDVELESVVREMERRMKYWQEKRHAWKAHKKQLDALRAHIASNVEDSSLDLMRRTLEVMESTHREHVTALALSKAEMASFAHHIDELRRRRGDGVFPN